MKRDKKSKSKKKLLSGGLVQYQQPNATTQADAQVDQTGQGIASALGPQYGALASVGTSASKSFTKDGSNTTNNFIGDTLDPYHQFKSVQQGGSEEKVAAFLNPIMASKLAADRKKEQYNKQLNKFKADQSVNLMENAGTFKDGGRLLAKNLNPKKGGSLTAISDDAVEVNADDPSKTDSVELDNAFVDNNEIIDRKKRVFSDSIALPNGRTIAKEAKRLEKMKAEDSQVRFKASNERLDQKLDDLFAYQEELKGEDPNMSEDQLKRGGNMKKKNHGANWNNFTNTEPDPEHPGQIANLKKGGTIHIKKENRGKFNATKKATGKTTEELTHSSNPVTKKRAIFAQNAAKWHHEFGGDLDPKPKRKPATLAEMKAGQPGRDFTKEPTTLEEIQGWTKEVKAKNDAFRSNLFKKKGLMNGGWFMEDPTNPTLYRGKKKLAEGGPFSMDDINPDGKIELTSLDQSSTTKPKRNIDWNQIGNAAATVAPNIANAFLQTRLKGPRSPYLETQAKLQRFSPDAQLTEAGREFNQAQSAISRGTAQASDMTSATGSLLAKRFAANNQIHSNINNLNNEIQNQEVGINQGVKARNVERSNEFRADQVNFKNRKTQLTSENIANLSNKVQANTRERNQMKKDQLAYNFLQAGYGDSGVLNRLKEQHPDWFETLDKKRMGGRIKGRMLNKKGC